MFDNIGRLIEADEGINHQIADTFSTIVESDFGWTEKLWGAFMRKDGKLTVSFGLGKYHNRDVMDAFGGVSRGVEQWTVRASRRLEPDLNTPAVGPVRYEVVEPLKKIRFRLDSNDTQPIAYDILFESELPPFFEKRNLARTPNRLGMNVVRYHQAGKISGWVEVDGERHVIDDDWFAFRDHSWGMRGRAVGAHPTDTRPLEPPAARRELLWSPSLLVRPDGSKYEIMHFWMARDGFTYFSAHHNEAGANSGEVRQTAYEAMEPDIRFDPVTRQFKGGTYTYIRPNGEKHTIEVEAVGDSGFYLRTGLYGGWAGSRHGSWMGDYHQDGEYIADVIQSRSKIGQFRDTPIRVRDGDAVGYGLQESIYDGTFPELGLTADSDFPSDL